MGRSSNIGNQFDSATVKLIDDTPTTPLEVEVLFVNGDISIGGLSAEGTDVSVYQTRRVVHSLRRGARTFPTISFSGMVSEFTEATIGTAHDMIQGTAGTPFAARISTTAAKGDVITLDVELTIDGAVTLFEDVHFTYDVSEGDPNSWSWSGTVYGNITGALAPAWS